MARRPTPPRSRARDLMADPAGLSALNDQPLVEVAKATLETARSILRSWDDLEPIVRALVSKVRAHVDSKDVKPADAARLLSTTARVVQQLAAASQGVMRAADGEHRLALLLSQQG